MNNEWMRCILPRKLKQVKALADPCFCCKKVLPGVVQLWHGADAKLRDVFNVFNLKGWNFEKYKGSLSGIEIPWTQWTGPADFGRSFLPFSNYFEAPCVQQCEPCFESDVFLVSLHSALALGQHSTMGIWVSSMQSCFPRILMPRFLLPLCRHLFWMNNFGCVKSPWSLPIIYRPPRNKSHSRGMHRSLFSIRAEHLQNQFFWQFQRFAYSSLSFIERGTCVRKAFTFEVMS